MSSLFGEVMKGQTVLSDASVTPIIMQMDIHNYYVYSTTNIKLYQKYSDVYFIDLLRIYTVVNDISL